ncbi:hypothetical protein INS49_003396 [Diaporthe citri]|uniref:uncharacterized protein n=1 Tax=Diaporthe citri TaxID=83186 RepID=UPI001C7E8CAD|nr:uncharacterized protein INS49_003396 [Diaporthe citri]KAG6355434.1 hypothetical protein INS49_003396 [Diaporthe citri]
MGHYRLTRSPQPLLLERIKKHIAVHCYLSTNVVAFTQDSSKKKKKKKKKKTRKPKGMDHNPRDQPDRAPPPLKYPTLEEMEAFKEEVENFEAKVEAFKEEVESLNEITTGVPQSNPGHMNTTMRLYRQPDPESKPKNLFFYGSLMDPDVLRVISLSSADPELHKASIHGFKLKMWGSSELKDGEFVLENYQLYSKPDIFKRKA